MTNELTKSLNKVIASFSYNYRGCLITKDATYWNALGRQFVNQKDAEKHIDNSFKSLAKTIR